MCFTEQQDLVLDLIISHLHYSHFGRFLRRHQSVRRHKKYLRCQ